MTQNDIHQISSSAISRIPHWSKYRRVLILALLVCGASAGFAGRAHRGAKSKSPAAAGVTAAPRLAPAPATAQGQSREPVKVVRFSLYDAGILPREAHVKQGLVALITEDYWGSAGLVVERETEGAPQFTGRVERAGPHWRGKSEMRLAPGRYQVYMAERPATRAVLVVEP